MNNLEIFGIPYFKKGSGIHIKKENRGLFTDYCGGKVTNECILRGKNSPDPKLRKRATFALNARAWKHLLGGSLQYSWPTYTEVQELWAKEDPLSYNTKQIKTGIRQGDFIYYTDAEGKQLRIPANIGLSGTDPVARDIVLGTIMGKPLLLAGNAALHGLGRAGNNWARAKILSKEINNAVGKGLLYFGKVKYYGPTMGKTTASKTNPDLVDFDDFTREAKNNLAKELNVSTRVLQSDPKYALIYLEMLEKELGKWRRNPLNADKTLVISKKGLADKNIYNNEPSIPDRLTFVLRLRNRGETDDANSNDWYNMILKQNPNLKTDNRFVSEIEYNPHYISYFKDKYGREVTPTPYPGPDSELVDAVTDALLAVLKDYFSTDKINQIKKTMNWGNLEISELLDEILRTIGKGSEVLIKGPKDGFTIIGEHQGKLYGTGADTKASHIVTLNRERMPDLLTAQEAGIHELGVHGKTASMQAEDFGKGGYSDNVKTMFPRLAEITLKNKELADALLVLNKRGLFLELFKNVGDLEKYFVNKGLSWKDEWDKFYNAFKYYRYATKADEKIARAYTGQLFNKVFDPNKKTLNIELLERFYTPESVEAFKKAVLGISPTIGILNNKNK